MKDSKQCWFTEVLKLPLLAFMRMYLEAARFCNLRVIPLVLILEMLNCLHYENWALPSRNTKLLILTGNDPLILRCLRICHFNKKCFS